MPWVSSLLASIASSVPQPSSPQRMELEQLQAQLVQQAEHLRQLSEQLSLEHQSRVQLQSQLQQQQALSSVRTPKPPETDGRKPTPQHFSEAFEVYLQQKGIDLNSAAACQLAATFLRDAALDWYVTHQQEVSAGKAAPFSSWQQMKEALFKRFSPYDTYELARDRRDRLVQQRSVAEYAAAYTGLMLQLPLMDEGDRIHSFVRGLKPTIRAQVAMQQPHTLDAAISLAMAADTLMFSSSAGAFGPFSSSSSGGSSAFRPAGRYNSSSSSSRPAPMELGSLQRTHPHPTTSSRQPYCSWHKRTGHWTADCRQRASAMHSQPAGGKAGKQ